MPEPLDGILASPLEYVVCQRCLDRGKSRHDSTIQEAKTGSWIVVDRRRGGGSYHLDCATYLGWVPTDTAIQLMTRYPKGPGA